MNTCLILLCTKKTIHVHILLLNKIYKCVTRCRNVNNLFVFASIIAMIRKKIVFEKHKRLNEVDHRVTRDQ